MTDEYVIVLPAPPDADRVPRYRTVLIRRRMIVCPLGCVMWAEDPDAVIAKLHADGRECWARGCRWHRRTREVDPTAGPPPGWTYADAITRLEAGGAP